MIADTSFSESVELIEKTPEGKRVKVGYLLSWSMLTLDNKSYFIGHRMRVACNSKINQNGHRILKYLELYIIDVEQN